MIETPLEPLQADLSEDISRKADVGVLFIHGIGDQKEGATLLSFAETAFEWLRDWYAGQTTTNSRVAVELRESRLEAVRTEAFSPAYALFDIENVDRQGKKQGEERWILTEAWWAGIVQPPPPFRLFLWLLERGPLLMFWHFRQAKRAYATALVIAGSMQFVVLTAMVLSILSFGLLRRSLAAAVRTLTLTLGDSFVLAEQDLQRTALIRRVERSIEWLSSRARKIIVVAHSQGAAIAHNAIQVAQPSQLVSFVSVGSGFEKLLFLRHVRANRLGQIPAALLPPIMLLLLVITPLAILGVIGVGWAVASVAAVLLIGWSAVQRLRDSLAVYERYIHLHLEASAIGGAEWKDIYATHDLVPMGKGSLLGKQSYMRQESIVNQRSFLHDHTGYFSNRLGFLPVLWNHLSTHSSLPFLRSEDFEVERMRWIHGSQVTLLHRSFIATVAMLLCCVVVLHNWVLLIGETIREALGYANLKAIALAIDFIGGRFMRVIEWTGYSGGAVDKIWISTFVLGLPVAICVAVAWWILFRACWIARDAWDFHRICFEPSVLEEFIWQDYFSIGKWYFIGVGIPVAVMLAAISSTLL